MMTATRQRALDEAITRLRRLPFALRPVAGVSGSQERAVVSSVAVEAFEISNLLADAGAVEIEEDRPQEDRLDLAELRALDSPEARELLDVLAHARRLADVVDAQRGVALPDGSGVALEDGSRLHGLDLASDLAGIEAKLRMEIHGAPGGRE